MKMKKNGWTAALRRKQYVIAGALVVVAAIGTTVYYSNTQEKERQQMEAELAQEMNQQPPEWQGLAVEEGTEEAAEASAFIPPKATESTETAEVEKESQPKTRKVTEKTVTEAESETETETEQDTSTDTSAEAEVLHFAPEDGMNWPMEGNVILNYSMDATTYFPTLDQYKYNPAIVISGDVNSKVYSVARGKVTKIENDPVTGCTMTVELGDGYEAVYGQLKELNFEVGDYVEAGHVLAYVSEPTKYFSVEGSNLYFELLKDGTPVDPVDYFES